jgi:gamma-tubulin complex component 2
MSGRAPPTAPSGRPEQQYPPQPSSRPGAPPTGYGGSSTSGGGGPGGIGRSTGRLAAAIAGAYGGRTSPAALDAKQQQQPPSYHHSSSRGGGGIPAAGAGSGRASSLAPSPSPTPAPPSAAAAAATQQQPGFSLRTNGDLFCVTDQDMEEPLVRGVPCVADTGAAGFAAPSSGSAISTTTACDDDDAAAQQAAAQQAAAEAAAAAAAALAPLARPAVVPACSPAWNQARPFLSAGLQLLLDGEPIALAPGGEGGGAAASSGPHNPPAPPTALAAERASDPSPDFRGVSLAAQEAALVDDLLYAFMGLEGRYARCAVARGPGPGTSRGPRVAFFLRPPPGLDPALAEQARRLLPVAEHVVAVQRFVETRGGLAHGSVAQALAAAMREALGEWLLFVTQLEHAQRRGGQGEMAVMQGQQQQRRGRLAPQQQQQQARRAGVGSTGRATATTATTTNNEGPLTLAALTYHLACGPAASMELLARVAADAASAELSAAALLDSLASRAARLSGDARGRALAGRLLGAAAEPYLRMLGRWLREGVLDDPYCEFMVQEDARVAAAGREALVRSASGLATAATAAATTGLDASASAATSTTAHAPGLDSPFWTQRFTLRLSSTNTNTTAVNSRAPAALALDVPRFLAPLAASVLATGRYLNAIRDCGRAVPRPVFPPGAALRLDPSSLLDAAGLGSGSGCSSGACAAAVRAAHDSASAALLAVVVRDSGLHAWLRSLKRFFLHERGDLALALLQDNFSAGEGGGSGGSGSSGDGALAAELARPARDARRPRLQALLDVAVRSSSVASDPHADDLSFVLDRRSLMELVRAALGGGAGGGAGAAAGEADGGGAAAHPQQQQQQLVWQQLLLTVEVGWPVSLVVGRRQLLQYQALFKLLFSLRHAERALLGARVALVRPAARGGGGGGRGASSSSSFLATSGGGGLTHEERAALRPWHACCQALLFCVQEVLRYAATDVVEPAWRRLERELSGARDVDALASAHGAFLASALSGCLLSSPALLRRVVALQESAEEFAALVRALVVLLPSSSAAGEEAAGGRPRAAATVAEAPAVRALRALASDAHAAARLRAIRARLARDAGALASDLGERHAALLRRSEAALAGAARDDGEDGGVQQQQQQQRAAAWSPAGEDDVVASREDLEALLNLAERLALAGASGGGFGEQQQQRAMGACGD